MSGMTSGIRRFFRRQPQPRVLSVTARPDRLRIILVPETLAAHTLAHLRAGGAQGCEEFAFWSGHVVDNGTAIVTRAFHPRTLQGRGHVSIDDDAQLLAMTDIVHEHDELVICQLHTHPADAFHSSADDAGAYTDEAGFLSLVLPSFATHDLASAETFLKTQSGWLHEGRAVETGLLRLFGDVLCYDGGVWRAA